MQGLEKTFRDKVQGQLRAENPKHHSDDPYTLADISTAALFVLSSFHMEYIKKEVSPVPIKKETFDLSSRYEHLNINAIADEVAKRIATPEKQQSTGGPNLPRLRTHHCIFCSDPDHYLSSCPHVSEYIQKGLCQKNTNGQIVLPNGNRVTNRDVPGKNLEDRLDNWHKTNTSPRVSTNFVGATEKETYAWAQELEDTDITSMILENLVVTTQKKLDSTKKNYGAAKQVNDGKETRSKTQVDMPEKGTTAHTGEENSR